MCNTVFNFLGSVAAGYSTADDGDAEGYSVQWRTEGGWVVGSNPPKFWRPSKILPNSTQLWKLLKIAEFGTPTP